MIPKEDRVPSALPLSFAHLTFMLYFLYAVCISQRDQVGNVRECWVSKEAL
jgi:hypothetical protein